MNRALLLPLLLVGCVQADVKHTSASGAVTEAHLRRLWASTSVSISPDGTVSYSSQPQSATADKALDVARQALGARLPAPLGLDQEPSFLPQSLHPLSAPEPPRLLPAHRRLYRDTGA